MVVIMIYKNKIRYFRYRNNIKEIDLAKILGISKSLYSEYENEIKTIPTKHMNTICNYLNVSFDYVLGFDSKPQYDNIILYEKLNLKLIGIKLKELRKNYNLTQEELGNIVGCSYGTIAGYEIGRYLISIPILYKICKKYHISADYLLGRLESYKNIN